jgi:hypothetical protein
MHPDIAREIIRQRVNEMRARASQDAMARAAVRGRRDRLAAVRNRLAVARHRRDRLAARDGLAMAGEVPAPRVPDYVDDGLCGAVDHTHAGA